MDTLRSILMYIYIFGPSARGVNTLAAKDWYRRMQKNKKEDHAHSMLRKKQAYRAGYMPELIDHFSAKELKDKNYITERDYIYIQPVNGLYRKWLRNYEVASRIFYPFRDHLAEEGKAPDDAEAILHLMVTNEDSSNPRIADVTAETCGGEKIDEPESIKAFPKICEMIMDMCRFAPQLEMWSCDVAAKGDDFCFFGFYNYPDFPHDRLFDDETNDFFVRKLESFRADQRNIKKRVGNAAERVGFKTRKLFTMAFFPKDLVPYLSLRWIKEVATDFVENKDAGFKEKIWAYKNGFLSYRLAQYGITEENRKDFISDFEYKWLRHINGDYRELFQDKITIKYILNNFNECFPEYYYHIRNSQGANAIVPMMDCPKEYKDTYEDILRLARDKGILALKPDEGSHGDGFYKLTYADGQYMLGTEKATEEDIIALLSDKRNQYLVTEYINNHPVFRKIYDGAVNTIRMVVFKDEDGKSHIGTAYMRMGSDQTHGVDNMGAGGIAISVDEKTGRFYNPRIITHNSIMKCDVHPDTGVPIEGYIPRWEEVKAKILEIADSVDQMEYFGFDVAVTEDGIKMPEINRFPDFPKMECLTPETMQYLLRKLDEKKKRCGYDKKPCRKLVHLPKR